MPEPTRHTIPAADYLSAVVDSSPNGIITIDLSGTIQTWNRSAQRILGYRAEEAVNQPVLLIIPPHLHAEEASILLRLRNGELIDSYESVCRRKDGHLVDVALTVSPVRDGNGTV